MIMERYFLPPVLNSKIKWAATGGSTGGNMNPNSGGCGGKDNVSSTKKGFGIASQKVRGRKQSEETMKRCSMNLDFQNSKLLFVYFLFVFLTVGVPHRGHADSMYKIGYNDTQIEKDYPEFFNMGADELLDRFHNPTKYATDSYIFADDPKRIALVLAMRKNSTKIIETTRIQLYDTSIDRRKEALMVLSNLGKHSSSVVEDIVRTYGDKNEQIREWAFIALSNTEDSTLIPLLLRASTDHSKYLRRRFFNTWWLFNKTDIYDSLNDGLTDTDIGVRVSAINACKNLADTRFLKQISNLLDDTSATHYNIIDETRVPHRVCDEVVHYFEQMINQKFYSRSSDKRSVKEKDNSVEKWKEWTKKNVSN